MAAKGMPPESRRLTAARSAARMRYTPNTRASGTRARRTGGSDSGSGFQTSRRPRTAYASKAPNVPRQPNASMRTLPVIGATSGATALTIAIRDSIRIAPGPGNRSRHDLGQYECRAAPERPHEAGRDELANRCGEHAREAGQCEQRDAA